MKHVDINFNDGDIIGIDCMDMVVNNGFLTVFLPEDEDGTKRVQGYAVHTVSDFEFTQTDEEVEE